MIPLFRLLFLAAVWASQTAATESPPSQMIVVQGSITNTTVDITAVARLELKIDGETVIATMHTEPPLTGSGRLEGRLQGGWCELRGKLNEGLVVALRGAINGKDFRGTYVVEMPRAPSQYGKFQFAVQPSTER